MGDKKGWVVHEIIGQAIINPRAIIHKEDVSDRGHIFVIFDAVELLGIRNYRCTNCGLNTVLDNNRYMCYGNKNIKGLSCNEIVLQDVLL
jgi:hypothetical protein